MIVTLLLLAAAPVAQATPASAGLPRDKVECRRIMEGHSRIPVRVCRLTKEWELLAEDAQKDLQTSRNQRSVVAQ